MTPVLEFYDSLHGTPEKLTVVRCMELLQRLRQLREISQRLPVPLQPVIREPLLHRDIPLQPNKKDCGVYMLQNSLCVATDTRMDYDGVDIQQFRNTIARNLLSGHVGHMETSPLPGCTNVSNMCYVNALVQTCAFPITVEPTPRCSVGKVYKELKCLAEASTKPGEPLDALRLQGAVNGECGERFPHGEQADVAEFWNYLWSSQEKERDPLYRRTTMEVVEFVQCYDCGLTGTDRDKRWTTKQKQPAPTLMLSLREGVNLFSDMVLRWFATREVQHLACGSNCGTNVTRRASGQGYLNTGRVRSGLLKVPDFVMVQILRWPSVGTEKSTQRVLLDAPRYAFAQEHEDPNVPASTQYRKVIGLVVHEGGAPDSGHYYSCRWVCGHLWDRCDDLKTTRLSWDYIKEDLRIQRNMYLVLLGPLDYVPRTGGARTTGRGVSFHQAHEGGGEATMKVCRIVYS